MVGTPSPQTISTKQLELAQRAERYPHEALSTLAHFIDLDWLREAYRRTRKDGAPQGSTAKWRRSTKRTWRRTYRAYSIGSNRGAIGHRP